ncbi:MAG: hypothetical protein EPO23_03270 [Xanthobacteraceae bacterium]|nr:MAG: hypothetical protein EPO23_03270 [Xanthobacteraceae bacterium]
MRGFQVAGGAVTIAAGELIAMTADQFRARAHNVELVREDRKSRAVICKVIVPLQFKAGEKIGLNELPKHLAGRLAPLGAETAEE